MAKVKSPGIRSGVCAADCLHELPHQDGESGASYANRILEYNILMLYMPPDAWIRESAIAERLGVSRTPVREAMSLLRDKGLVDVQPKSASHVSRIDLDAVKQGCFLRTCVEPAVFAQAIGNIDDTHLELLSQNMARQRSAMAAEDEAFRSIGLDNEFHHIVYQATHKELVWESVRKASTQFDRIRYMGLLMGYETPNPHAHEELYHLLAYSAGLSLADVAPVIQQHLNHYLSYIDSIVQDFPDYFTHGVIAAGRTDPEGSSD